MKKNSRIFEVYEYRLKTPSGFTVFYSLIPEQPTGLKADPLKNFFRIDSLEPNAETPPGQLAEMLGIPYNRIVVFRDYKPNGEAQMLQGGGVAAFLAGDFSEYTAPE